MRHCFTPLSPLMLSALLQPSNLEVREVRGRRNRSPLPVLPGRGAEVDDELSQLIETMEEGELSTLRASLDDTMELGQLSMEEEAAVKFSQGKEGEREEGGREGSKVQQQKSRVSRVHKDKPNATWQSRENEEGGRGGEGRRRGQQGQRGQGGSGLSRMVRMEEASPSRSLRHVVLDVEQCRELHMSLQRQGHEGGKERTQGEGREEREAREKDRSGEEGKSKEEENKGDENKEENSDVHQDPPSPPLDQDMQGSLRQHAQLVGDSFLRDKFEGSPFIDKLLEEDAGDSSFPSFCDLLQRVAAECSLSLTFSSSSPPPLPPRSDDQGQNTILSTSAGSPAARRRSRESLGGRQVGMQVERLLEVKQADYELYMLSILSGLVQSEPPSMRHPSPASSRRQKSIDEIEKQVR